MAKLPLSTSVATRMSTCAGDQADFSTKEHTMDASRSTILIARSVAPQSAAPPHPMIVIRANRQTPQSPSGLRTGFKSNLIPDTISVCIGLSLDASGQIIRKSFSQNNFRRFGAPMRLNSVRNAG